MEDKKLNLPYTREEWELLSTPFNKPLSEKCEKHFLPHLKQMKQLQKQGDIRKIVDDYGEDSVMSRILAKAENKSAEMGRIISLLKAGKKIKLQG